MDSDAAHTACAHKLLHLHVVVDTSVLCNSQGLVGVKNQII